VQCFADQRGQGRRLAAGRNRNRYIVTPHDTAEIGGRVRRIVNGVDKNAPLFRSIRDLAIDVAGRRRDDEPRTVKVRRLEFAEGDLDVRRGGDFGDHQRRDDANGRLGRQQLLQFAGGNRTAADQQHVAAGQIDEQGKQVAHK
jgi:hypothetical protein